MKRRFLLFASVWSPVYIVLFVVLVLEATIRNGGDPDNDLLVPFGLVVALHLATIGLGLVAMVVALVDALRSPRLTPDERIVWAVLLVVFNVFVLPVYWWKHVRPRRGDEPAFSEAPERPPGVRPATPSRS